MSKLGIGLKRVLGLNGTKSHRQVGGYHLAWEE